MVVVCFSRSSKPAAGVASLLELAAQATDHYVEALLEFLVSVVGGELGGE